MITCYNWFWNYLTFFWELCVLKSDPWTSLLLNSLGNEKGSDLNLLCEFLLQYYSSNLAFKSFAELSFDVFSLIESELFKFLKI